MDLVKLCYRYINEFINSVELREALESLSLKKDTDERAEIENLIAAIKDTADKIPNTIDEEEKTRKEQLKRLINMVESNPEEVKEFDVIKKFRENLKYNYEKVTDNLERRTAVKKVLADSPLVRNALANMSDEDLLNLITGYIGTSNPPDIDNKTLDKLINIAISEKNPEKVWRLASNYSEKKIYSELIEDYFIEQRDSYYLQELLSIEYNCIDITDRVIDKINKTGDKDFIINMKDRLTDLSLLSREQQDKFDI